MVTTFHRVYLTYKQNAELSQAAVCLCQILKGQCYALNLFWLRREEQQHEYLISYLISLVAESCGHHNKLVVVNIKVTIAEPTVNLNNDHR
jgi:hypothetical protein